MTTQWFIRSSTTTLTASFVANKFEMVTYEVEQKFKYYRILNCYDCSFP